jgi:hypothetical protein
VLPLPDTRAHPSGQVKIQSFSAKVSALPTECQQESAILAVRARTGGKPSDANALTRLLRQMGGIPASCHRIVVDHLPSSLNPKKNQKTKSGRNTWQTWTRWTTRNCSSSFALVWTHTPWLSLKCVHKSGEAATIRQECRIVNSAFFVLRINFAFARMGDNGALSHNVSRKDAIRQINQFR